ncbi:MAG: hypothetical protein ACI8Y4_005598 [Candidatus Poriferisodalaceae bacterium]
MYAELRERDPEDVWLYNSAGWIYRGVDDREALRWLLDGIDMARETWDQLDEPHDAALVAQVETFLADWVRPPYPPSSAMDGSFSIPKVRPCGHCGFDPDQPPPEARLPATQAGATTKVVMALAWFPSNEWAESRPASSGLPAIPQVSH